MYKYYKVAATIFLIALSYRVSATHNRSGEILYKRLAPYTQIVNGLTVPLFSYSITVYTYTDDGPGIADRCEDTVYFGDGQKGVATRINGPGNCGGCSFCGVLIVNDPTYKVKMNIYSINHIYNGAGSYSVSMSDPSRNSGIINIPNSGGAPFVIQSLIIVPASGEPNSSPVLSNPPIYFGNLQSCFNYNPCAFDPDDDSLSYELVPCIATGYFDPPSGANGSFSINAVTGLLSWCKPQLNGMYDISIRVKEWKKAGCNGTNQLKGFVTRDMVVFVVPTQSLVFSCVSGPDDCVIAGANFTRTITSSVGSGSFSAGLFGSTVFSGNPPLASLSPVSGNSTLTSTFNWQTACAHVQKNPHLINLVYTSGYQTFYSQFNLSVIPPAPLITYVTNDTGKVTLYWSAVSTCSSMITGYNIYRKTGNNSWSPGPCETGAPANSGFLYLGTANATVTSYVDNNFYSFQSGSTGNYFVTTLMNDCAESYASNIKSLTVIVGLHENSLKEDLKVYPNPFTNQLELDLPLDYSVNIDLSIYNVEGKQVFKSAGAEKGKIILGLNDLKKGIYFLQLKSGNESFSKKIIKS